MPGTDEQSEAEHDESSASDPDVAAVEAGWARLEGRRREMSEVVSDLRATTAEIRARLHPHRERIAWGIVIAAILYYCFLFVPLMFTNHRNFGNQHFDTGIFDQAAYLIAHGEHFMSGRGINVFGHHANFGLYFFAPFYWLGLGGPNLLNTAQVLSLAIAAVPVFLLAKNRTESFAVGVVIALAYLAHFSLSGMINEGFHPEAMAVPAVFAAFYFADRERWGWYGAALVYAVLWKEDVSLFVAMFGLYVYFAKSKKAGLLTAAAAVGYYLAISVVVLPFFSEAGATFYAGDYGILGDSGLEVATNALVFERDETFRLLEKHDATGYLFDLGQPYGWLSYLSPLWMLLAVPQLAANFLNIHGLAANPLLHYAAMPMVALTLGLVATFRARENPWIRAGLATWLLIFSFNTATSRGFTPHSDNYETGVWQLYDNERTKDMEGAAALIPGDAVISVTYNMSPHYTARSGVYMYPNPYRRDYWGVGEVPALHDPGVIDYLVLDRAVLSEESLALVDSLSGEFETIYESGMVIVLRRV